MQIGFIGLGRMGYKMVERLLAHNVKVVVYNRSQDKVKSIAKKGAIGSKDLSDLVGKLKGRKIIWLMLPAGSVTHNMILNLLPLLNRGDIIIDGANDFYKNAQKKSRTCQKRRIYFFDCGVSGGVWGKKFGYTLMVGGPAAQFKKIEPICRALAPQGGYGYFGRVGAGHFVKSVHNIVEYIYLQGLAEGVEILNSYEDKIDLVKATKVWRPASVVRSWLLDLANIALQRQDFARISPKIDSVTIQELTQTVKAVKARSLAFEVATKIRKDKSKNFLLGKRLIAAVRREFGGHNVTKKK